MDFTIEDKIASNLGLVYAQLKRFNLYGNQDAESIAYEALYKAVLNFDTSKTVKFSTYATVCIYNAIGCYMRSQNRVRQLPTVSYDVEVSNSTGDTTSLLSFISDSILLEDDYNKKELYKEMYQLIHTYIAGIKNDKQKRIVVTWLNTFGECSISTVAKLCKVSQSYASQVLQIFKSSIKKQLEGFMNE